MQLPNKLYSYNNSILPVLSIILSELKKESLPLDKLFLKTRSRIEDPSDFILAMDYLYALRKVIVDDNGEVSLC